VLSSAPISSALFAGFGACATPATDRVDDEYLAVVRNCELSGARLIRHEAIHRLATLALPGETDAAPEPVPARERVAGVAHWAHERGLGLALAEAVR
jgi:hypothetical protein